MHTWPPGWGDPPPARKKECFPAQVPGGGAMQIPRVTWLKRARQIAEWRAAGASAEAAVRMAGYGAGTARKKAYRIANRPEVRAELVRINQQLAAAGGPDIWAELVTSPDTPMEMLVEVTQIRVRQAARAQEMHAA